MYVVYDYFVYRLTVHCLTDNVYAYIRSYHILFFLLIVVRKLLQIILLQTKRGCQITIILQLLVKI